MVSTEDIFFDDKRFLIPFEREIIFALVLINDCNVVIGSSDIRMIFSENFFSYGKRFLIPF